MQNDLLPADRPDWGGPYNFGWFKYHHFETLNTHANAIQEQQDRLPSGVVYPPAEIKIVLHHLDELIKLANRLPATSDGQYCLEAIVKKRNAFEIAVQQNDHTGMSYWVVQEIVMKVFELQNYMSAMCEE